MFSRKTLIAAAVALALVGGILFVGTAQAAPTTTNLFTTTSILGINVITGSGGMSASKMVTYDMTNATSSEDFVLPALSANDKVVYFIKAYGQSSNHTLRVTPSEGDMIDMMPNIVDIGSETGFLVLIGDAANDTWWKYGYGYQ